MEVFQGGLNKKDFYRLKEPKRSLPGGWQKGVSF